MNILSTEHFTFIDEVKHMKTHFMVLISSVLFALSAKAFSKAEVEITWQEPEKYRDVRGSNESRKRFMERTFRQLDEFIAELAEDLPEGQKLLITVDDLDLAGEVWPASFLGFGHGGAEIRQVRQIDIPRMSFTYQLLDQSDQVIQGAAVKLKDMGFQERLIGRLSNEALRYEKNMLAAWFKDEFSQPEGEQQ